ncbi:slit homolog 1 protein-like [Patella vulgata]|uniref:slit homolog 1 protein-like n=1 Tax=Patella vulgata TaxID=6465 RepID=UPI0021808337|nr:slit homolog 1 protein-like [Patella vulgata]
MDWIYMLLLTCFSMISHLVVSSDDCGCDDNPEVVKLYRHDLPSNLSGVDVFYDVDLSNDSITDLQTLLSSSLTSIRHHIIHLDLSYNHIQQVQRSFFTALPKLRSILLSSNNISSLDKDVFMDAKCLQTIDISGNHIKQLPSGLLGRQGEVLRIKTFDASRNQISFMGSELFHEGLVYLKNVDISFNNLEYFDSWPYRTRSINPGDVSGCPIDLDLSSLSFNFISTEGYTFNLSHNNISYFRKAVGMEPGQQKNFKVDLTFNNLQDFAGCIKALNANTPSGVAILRLELKNNPWFCDCSLYNVAHNVHNSVYTDQAREYLYCQDPPDLQNRSFGYLVENTDKLICNISEDCPMGCLCQDRPAESLLAVDCSMVKNLTELPDRLPKYPRISLNVSGNQIEKIVTRRYAHALTRLDVSHNRLTSIHPKFFDDSKILKFVDISNNFLTSLPITLRNLRLPLSDVRVENNSLVCSCDTLWMNEWLKELNETNLRCTANGNVQYMQSVTYNSLTCYRDKLLIACFFLGCLLSVIIISVVVVYKWKYETSVLLYHIFGVRPFDKPKQVQPFDIHEYEPVFTTDVYISSNRQNPKIIGWVTKKLLPKLENFKKTCYYPPKDDIPGDSIADVITNAMASSRNILVILDDSILDREWCMEEFYMGHQIAGKVILVLFDSPTKFEDIETEPIKTYINRQNYIQMNHKLFWHKLEYELSKAN